MRFSGKCVLRGTPLFIKIIENIGVMITDEQSAWKCIASLHELGPSKVVITSTNLVENNEMIGFFSDNSSNIKGVIHIPQITDRRLVTSENQSGFVHFIGTGDMFAACLCGHSGTLQLKNSF